MSPPPMNDLKALAAACRDYRQADADGVMVLVSRQACDEAATILDRLASVQGDMETTSWDRDQWRFGVNPFSKEDRERLLRDFDRMIVNYLNAKAEVDRLLARVVAGEGKTDRLVESLRHFKRDAEAAVNPDAEDSEVAVDLGITHGDLRAILAALATLTEGA